MASDLDAQSLTGTVFKEHELADMYGLFQLVQPCLREGSWTASIYSIRLQ